MNSVARGHALALFSVTVWGLTFISTKVLLQSFIPAEILVFRFALGFVVLWIASPRVVRIEKSRQKTFAAAGLCGVALYFLLENSALALSPASNVSVIVAVAPFFTAQFSRLAGGGEKPRAGFYIGFAAAIAGIVMISFDGVETLRLSPAGDFLALLAAMVWAVYSLIVKRINGYGYPPAAATRRIFFYGLLFMVPAGWLLGFGQGIAHIAKPVNMLNLLFLGVVACAGCFVAWNGAIKHLGPVKTSIYIYLIPVVTVIASGLILNERLTPVSACGAALTLSGLLLSEIKGHSKKQ